MVSILEDKVDTLPEQSFRNGKDFFYEKGGLFVGVRGQFEEVASQIQSMLADMKYGSITIVVQDGKVIQLEKSEKVRLK